MTNSNWKCPPAQRRCGSPITQDGSEVNYRPLKQAVEAGYPMKPKFIFVFPKKSQDTMSKVLRKLTWAIHCKLGTPSFNGLGGTWGYGAIWNSVVFSMHPYCCCTDDGCPLHDRCTCDLARDRRYYVDGREVSVEDYTKLRKDIIGPSPSEINKFGTSEFEDREKEWKEKIKECSLRTRIEVVNLCRSCSGDGFPNFHAKGIGLRVWWYKWIGRSMDMEAEQSISWPEIRTAFRECFDDVRATPSEEASAMVIRSARILTHRDAGNRL